MAEYIEREAAIAVIQENYAQAAMVGAFDGAARLVAVVGEITSIPAANVRENVTGEWIDKRITVKGGHGLTYGRWGCSKCKTKQEHRTPFCPNCGADMTGGNDG